MHQSRSRLDVEVLPDVARRLTLRTTCHHDHDECRRHREVGHLDELSQTLSRRPCERL
jgi:hypothetical protein